MNKRPIDVKAFVVFEPNFAHYLILEIQRKIKGIKHELKNWSK